MTTLELYKKELSAALQHAIPYMQSDEIINATVEVLGYWGLTAKIQISSSFSKKHTTKQPTIEKPHTHEKTNSPSSSTSGKHTR